MSKLHYRAMHLKADAKAGEAKNRFTCIASTDEAYDNGYYKEILRHDADSVRTDGAGSMLFNHNRYQIIGPIVSAKPDGRQMPAEFDVLPSAKLENGVSVLEAVETGALRGVSVGYDYDLKDCVITYEKREYKDSEGRTQIENYPTVDVRKWSLREISLTPTPADLTAKVDRKDAESFVRAIRALGEPMKTANAPEAPANDVDEVKLAREAKEKAEKDLADTRLALVRSESRNLARSHGFELSDEEVSGIRTSEDAKDLVLKKKTEAEEKNNPKTTTVQVQRDAADKADEAAQNGLMYLFGVRTEANKGMQSGSILDIARRWLAARGVNGVLLMDRNILARAIIGKDPRATIQMGQRDAGNITSGIFTSYLMANVMDKVVLKAFESFPDATYKLWTGEHFAQDFKQFTGAGLSLGNLQETAENTAFQELDSEEDGYNASLGMWGGTLGLTYQAIANDDLGAFMKKLSRAGSIAQRTIDKKVYAVLAALTWTNKTTAGDLTDDTVSANRASMEQIQDPNGETLGNVPKFLIVPSGLRSKSLGITQLAPQVELALTALRVNTDLIPIITPYLTTAATPAQSTWYLAASQQLVDTVSVGYLQGVNAPMVEEYDAGAVAARKWKIMFPFVVFAGPIYGMWRGTHA